MEKQGSVLVASFVLGAPKDVVEYYSLVRDANMATMCACGETWTGETPPGYRAAMEFERGKEVFGDPNKFERK